MTESLVSGTATQGEVPEIAFHFSAETTDIQVVKAGCRSRQADQALSRIAPEGMRTVTAEVLAVGVPEGGVELEAEGVAERGRDGALHSLSALAIEIAPFEAYLAIHGGHGRAVSKGSGREGNRGDGSNSKGEEFGVFGHGHLVIKFALCEQMKSLYLPGLAHSGLCNDWSENRAATGFTVRYPVLSGLCCMGIDPDLSTTDFH